MLQRRTFRISDSGVVREGRAGESVLGGGVGVNGFHWFTHPGLEGRQISVEGSHSSRAIPWRSLRRTDPCRTGLAK